MANQFHDNYPDLANQINADIPDIAESLGFLKDVFENFCTTWSNTDATGIFPAKVAYVSKAADYTATAADFMIDVDASLAARTITLPTAASVAGRGYVIKKIDSSTNAVTIATYGTETIDGASSLTLDKQYQAVGVRSNGTNWAIVGEYLDLSDTVSIGGHYAETFTGADESSVIDVFNCSPKDQIDKFTQVAFSGRISGDTAGVVNTATLYAYTGSWVSTGATISITGATGNILKSSYVSIPSNAEIFTFTVSTDGAATVVLRGPTLYFK